MIHIQKEDIDDIASYWAFSLKAYLYNDLGHHKVKYTDSNKREHVFSRRIDKYESIFKDKCKNIKDISDEEKSSLWRNITALLNDTQFLRGSEEICDEYAAYQTSYFRSHKEMLRVVGEIFKDIYTDFSDKIAYDIFKMIGLRTCPYCNRHYTFTLSSSPGEFKTRPEFDHFYDKSTYPMLAVTFFNLVPSCKECNHGKGTKEVGVNPYFAGFASKFVLVKPSANPEPQPMNINEILNISKEDDFNVDFHLPEDETIRTAEEKNMKNLGLRPLYNMHKDYVMEIVEKVAAYDVLTRDGITERFQGLYHTETDVFNLIFGRYLLDAEQPKRPLSKLTADILTQMEINITSQIE